MVQRLNLTRDQLASFLQDHEQIKQFERLFSTANTNSILIDEVNISAGNAGGSANDALAQIIELSDTLNKEPAAANASQLAVIESDIQGLSLAPTNRSGILPTMEGGTGQNSYADGQILIGSTAANTLIKALLTPGANITITNSAGSITIAVSGLGTMAFKNIGVSGSFVAGLNTVTVVDGIITSIV
jgi:hypothetical protein